VAVQERRVEPDGDATVTAEQLDMFGQLTEPRQRSGRQPAKISARFEAFHKANPHVLGEMLRLARARVAAGATRIGVKALWEELRVALAKRDLAYDADFKAFKLNNSFTALYARALIELEPSLGNVIEIRRRKAK
jgi:hypothetical protein